MWATLFAGMLMVVDSVEHHGLNEFAPLEEFS